MTLVSGSLGYYAGSRHLLAPAEAAAASGCAGLADVNANDPACVAIATLVANGIISGYATTPPRFGPADPVQRAQVATFLVRALDWQSQPTGPRAFTDFGSLVGELRNASLILANKCDAGGCAATGYGDGRFGPTDSVSYAQVISFVARTLRFAPDYNWQPQSGVNIPYAGVPSAHQIDVRTYHHYAGGIPAAPVSAAGWNATAPRAWVARVLFEALDLPPAASPSPSQAPSSSPAPIAGQPCPAWVHDRYRAAGPDGKLYATWHPPTDPEYGCFFGHEHGDDPNGAPALRGRTIIFDYVNGLAGRSEAHVGFKIFRWDNVQHPNAPSHSGAQLVMMIHQGSSTDNAFTEPFHEISVHYYNPNDGREIHAYMLAPFGTLGVGCGANDPDLVRIRQVNAPGMRQIPDQQCFGVALKNAPGTKPDSIPYEDWITALYIGADSQGNAKAYFDPHFAIFNPNRYCILQDGTCTLGRSDVRARTGIDPFSTRSDYKGAKREAYLNQAWTTNAGGSTAVWTDVHGKLVAPNSPGAIQQYVSAINARPQVNSSAFDAEAENDDGTVRAPN